MEINHRKKITQGTFFLTSLASLVSFEIFQIHLYNPVYEDFVLIFNFTLYECNNYLTTLLLTSQLLPSIQIDSFISVTSYQFFHLHFVCPELKKLSTLE